MRDRVAAHQVQPHRLLGADRVEGSAQRAHHQVLVAVRYLVAALALGDDPGRAVDHGGADVVVQVERQPQAVEAGAEVRAGGGHQHAGAAADADHRLPAHPSRPSARATVTASAGTRTGSMSAPSTVRSAHWGPSGRARSP
ncbi:hypothetical protein GCM10025868_38510 [Angustibacter aerolatus]|uniref:Uncharacterized protein n=1 Tax=Angustibacter aerolatus TaxID=1162965 RepID=A0ABQ6JK09_9ACTN|nr:hypothetical protein GCM10025868_38510 [Angustibacter aerolatus]